MLKVLSGRMPNSMTTSNASAVKFDLRSCGSLKASTSREWSIAVSVSRCMTFRTPALMTTNSKLSNIKDGKLNKAYAGYVEATGEDVRTLGIDALTPEQLIERTTTAIQKYI